MEKVPLGVVAIGLIKYEGYMEEDLELESGSRHCEGVSTHEENGRRKTPG